MLVRLFGKNFRSLKDNFELSMVAADLKRKVDRDRGVIELPIAGADEPLRLLRTVAIYARTHRENRRFSSRARVELACNGVQRPIATRRENPSP